MYDLGIKQNTGVCEFTINKAWYKQPSKDVKSAISQGIAMPCVERGMITKYTICEAINSKDLLF